MSSSKGLHGDGFKFMPVVKFNQGEHFPRFVNIAGVYPGITVEEVFAPLSQPAPEQGFWTYKFPDPEDQLGCVALPGSDTLFACIDPVIIVTDTDSLGIRAREKSEVLAIVDRQDVVFGPENFYVFSNPTKEVEICSMSELEEGYDVLGRVVLCYLPRDKAIKPPSGFAEDEDMDY